MARDQVCSPAKEAAARRLSNSGDGLIIPTGLDVYRNRLDFNPLAKDVLRMRRRWRADKIIIELAATGKPLIRELHRTHR